MEYKEQNCPLCGETAKYKMIANDQSKHFNCKNCTEFIVTIEAEEILKDSDFPESNLRKLSTQSSKTINKKYIYLIHCPDDDDEIIIFPKVVLKGHSIERHNDFW